jgi:hypothetical protein
LARYYRFRRRRRRRFRRKPRRSYRYRGPNLHVYRAQRALARSAARRKAAVDFRRGNLLLPPVPYKYDNAASMSRTWDELTSNSDWSYVLNLDGIDADVVLEADSGEYIWAPQTDGAGTDRNKRLSNILRFPSKRVALTLRQAADQEYSYYIALLHTWIEPYATEPIEEDSLTYSARVNVSSYYGPSQIFDNWNYAYDDENIMNLRVKRVIDQHAHEKFKIQQVKNFRWNTYSGNPQRQRLQFRVPDYITTYGADWSDGSTGEDARNGNILNNSYCFVVLTDAPHDNASYGFSYDFDIPFIEVSER